MGSRNTRESEIYEQLRADILAGALKPGERLRYQPLVERYGVSMGVLRGALGLLAEQGLVTTQPQRGSHVTRIDVNHLKELTEARAEIEPLVLRHAIEDGDRAWEASVVAAHYQLHATSVYDSETGAVSKTWSELHENFHDVILSGCSNTLLLETARDWRALGALYLRVSIPASGSRDIAGEHAAIADAITDRDAPRAARLLADHIRSTTEGLLSTGLIKEIKESGV